MISHLKLDLANNACLFHRFDHLTVFVKKEGRYLHREDMYSPLCRCLDLAEVTLIIAGDYNSLKIGMRGVKLLVLR